MVAVPRHLPPNNRPGFTLLEMLLAVMILAIMTTVTAVSFSAVLNNWRKSTDVVDRMQTADYAFSQVVAGLRSAYYPTDGKQDDNWGFQLYDNGDGDDEKSSDTIIWTKLGTAIVGDKLQAAETAHKVQLWVAPADHDKPGGLYVKTWTPDLINTDANNFDEDELGDEFLLVQDVVGFDCQVQKNPKEAEDDGRPKWEDTWDTSNSIPYRVKLTFRLKPADVRDDSIPVMRVVQIPLWDISQNPINSTEDQTADATKGTSSGSKKSGGTSSSKGGGTSGGMTSGGGATGGGAAGGAGTGGVAPVMPPAGGGAR